ncbi:MAG: shikimate dehydrogenase [Spirochaetales bacterium]|nr:shikimate dehydrogenase [Spirochaetales bacterium]
MENNVITIHTKLISLLGDPLGQTFAPRMFNETFHRLGLDYLYFPIEVGNENLETIVKAIRCMHYVGFNVTKPNKIKILEYLDELDGLAEKIGSVNVVTVRDGVLKGYNTDGIGFVQSLLDETKMDLGEQTFLILGAGGASRAVSSTLAFRGAKKIYIVDSFEKASSTLAEDINHKIRPCAEYIEFSRPDIPELIKTSTVLINATGLGMYPDTEATPVEKKNLYRELFVCDLTYNPPRTRLLRDAEEVGCAVMNGIGMVVNQGIKGFALMTGEEEPNEIMNKVMQEIIGGKM